MKYLFAALLMAGAPLLAQAQGATTPSTKPAAKASPSKPAPSKASKPPLKRSAQKAVEEATPIDIDPAIQLSETDLDVARKVYVGDMKCELGNNVKISPHRREGFFLVATKGHRFYMHPVESRTGAIRLEDTRRGAMWLQLGNKSMLMSQKLGQRLADECQSPEQVTHAEHLKKNPLPNLLEDHKPMHGQHGTGHGGHHHGGMMHGQPSAATPSPAAAVPGDPAGGASAPVVPNASTAAPAAPGTMATDATGATSAVSTAPPAPAAAPAPAGNLDTTVAP